MEPLPNSDILTVETVVQPSEMEIFEVEDQSIVETEETVVVTGFEMTDTEVTVQVGESITTLPGRQEVDDGFRQEGPISQPLLEALDLTLHEVSSTGDGVDGTAHEVQANSSLKESITDDVQAIHVATQDLLPAADGSLKESIAEDVQERATQDILPSADNSIKESIIEDDQEIAVQDLLPSLDAAQKMVQSDDQAEVAKDKMEMDTELPQDHATDEEDEETEEIIFVCIHGQTFRCKPQAGTRVKAAKVESAHEDSACACSKVKNPDEKGTSQDGESPRKLRSWKQKFTCGKCGGRFTQKASLDRHISTHDEEEEENKTGAATGVTENTSEISKGDKTLKTRSQQKQETEAKSSPDMSCPDCGRVFSRLRPLEIHRKQHEKEKRKAPTAGKKSNRKGDTGRVAKKQDALKCKICDLMFDNRYKLRLHEQDHSSSEETEKFSCKECSKVFSRQYNLQRHEKIHIEKKTKVDLEVDLTCKDCSKVFTKASHLKRHEKVHAKKKGVVIHCPRCPETFEDKFTYKIHKKAHTAQNAYRDMECELCKKVVKGPSTLKRHMRTHTKEKPYPCRIGCNSFFSSTSYRLNHERMHCKMSQSYLCTECGEVLANKAKLLHHESKYHCDSLDEHGNLRQRREYPCRHCGKIFYFSAVRKRHERIHTNEKPYMCQFCPKAFVHANALLCHERVHTKERPYACGVCDKTFSQPTHLKTHMRVHTKEKPYECRFCKQAFSHMGTRKSHEATHKNIILQEVVPVEASSHQIKDEIVHVQEDIPDAGMQEVVPEKIIVTHPEHEVQAADVILQLLQSGNRMPNFEGLVHIVTS